ncbi:uncharacterized protein Z518_03123 [Rhinocladiella mackenziei CBS 650.93]|uniref:Carboxylic ester hydrolase n=1 Tax=Rhinocladiella mackenziei CBS 650.93 TaxID=1442369 RepID=A0A0D2G1U9_9EURO|nr:uncharacterized protein Z518_03123 [Rhinocladiella mackenziei CBS 650.93]KIX08467.1 hypothetical protein Z518_03123 [Rhinocladiella mackenziei CBS 650.93]
MELDSSQLVVGGQMFGTQCASLIPPIVPGAAVVNMSAAEVHSFNYPAVPLFSPTEITDLSFCNVTVALTHPIANDTVYVTVWLPLTGWNGRYQATGGGGLAAGIGEPMLVGPVAAGLAASSTEGGLTLNHTVNPQLGEWALKQDGSANEDLMLNLAWRSIHDMAIVSKDIIKQFYGVKPSYSYWHGCSQGGRQGYAAAAKYPYDFDGILAIAPALSIAHFAPADVWAPVVMRNSDEVPPFCVFEAYHKAIIAECDPLDGVADGLISDYEILETCPFDPVSLVGTEILCEEGCMEFDPLTLVGKRVACRHTTNLTITTVHADIVSKILQGPRTDDGKQLWWGLAPGASFFATAHTILTEDGARIPQPFVAGENWVKYLAMRNASYDMTKMTYPEYFKAFDESVSRLDPLWGDEQYDLTEFRHRGGKLLTWFGLADEYIPPPGMFRFREKVEEKFGGPKAVDEFYRLFLAPGVGHCFGGVGPMPTDPFEALISWVERDKAPDVLPAATTMHNVEVQRDLCRYPKKLVYKGGDVNVKDSFVCE